MNIWRDKMIRTYYYTRVDDRPKFLDESIAWCQYDDVENYKREECEKWIRMNKNMSDRILELEEKLKVARKAMLKIKKSMKEGGFGHAIWCNYQHPTNKWCNCGLADILTASEKIKD
jgi:hypothetical protein